MRKLLTILLILMTVAEGYSQNKLVKQLEKLERQRFEAMCEKDVGLLKTMLTEQLSYTHSNGLVESKDQHLENIKSGKIVYQKIQPEGLKIRTFKKSAIITGFVQVAGLYNNTPFDVRLHYLDIYIKQRRKWKLAAWESVKVKKLP